VDGNICLCKHLEFFENHPKFTRHDGTDRLYERRLTASIANYKQSDVAAGDNNMAATVSCILRHKKLIYRAESIIIIKKLSTSIISSACLFVCPSVGSSLCVGSRD